MYDYIRNKFSTIWNDQQWNVTIKNKIEPCLVWMLTFFATCTCTNSMTNFKYSSQIYVWTCTTLFPLYKISFEAIKHHLIVTFLTRRTFQSECEHMPLCMKWNGNNSILQHKSSQCSREKFQVLYHHTVVEIQPIIMLWVSQLSCNLSS